jgi:multicomponent Na+:H+ antiporter subunit A
LVLAATAVRADSSVSRWLSDNSLPLANGRNVVNVILVDFRALDTLGEITVLGVAAIGVFALMKLRLDA